MLQHLLLRIKKRLTKDQYSDDVVALVLVHQLRVCIVISSCTAAGFPPNSALGQRLQKSLTTKSHSFDETGRSKQLCFH
jgi:hypothetical protein